MKKAIHIENYPEVREVINLAHIHVSRVSKYRTIERVYFFFHTVSHRWMFKCDEPPTENAEWIIVLPTFETLFAEILGKCPEIEEFESRWREYSED